MKYKKYIIMPMLLALLSVATSCEQEELPPAVPEGDVVEVTATIGDAPDTRVSQPEDNVYTFEPNDKIHIVGWYGDWDDYNRPWEMASYTWWNDAVSTYDGYKWKTEPYMRWQNGDGLQHNFLAWWPEDFIKSSDNLTSVDVTVTGDYKKDDILLARWTGNRPDDNTLELQFKHLLSRFDVHLFFRNEYTTYSDISIETNLMNTAVCNFLTGDFISTSGEGIKMQARPHPDGNCHWSGTCITVPQDFAGRPLLTLQFTTHDGEKTIDYEHTGLLNFRSGQRITLYLVVGKEKLELMDVTVNDWEPAPDIDGGEAEEEINYTYDEAANTYTVYTAEGLLAWNNAVRYTLTSNLVLAADITLTGENNWTPLGGKDRFGYPSLYKGVINGNGHTITGLHINSDSEYQGFIGRIGEGGTIKNLTFADAHVTAGQYSGIVVGGSDNGTIENCHVTSGSLTATNDCTGGIVGSNGGIVIDCTNAATITVAQGATDAGRLGGIAGNSFYNGIIIGCINTGSILSGNFSIGGILGDNSGIVVACSNKGTVADSSRTGGIVGWSTLQRAQTIGSWSIATTESDADGDGIGDLPYGTATGCFTGDASTINVKISDMNAAIAAYNETATVPCPYTWQASTDGGYPTLVKVTE